MVAAGADEVWEEMQREALGPRAGQTVDLAALQRQKQRQCQKPRRQGWPTALKELEGTAKSALKVTEPPATLIDVVEEIPAGTPETFLAYLQRDVNCLGEENLQVRLRSLRKLEAALVGGMENLATDVVDAAAEALLKPLLKRLRDRSEKCREASLRILTSLVENASDLSAMLPYVFPALVARLGCADLDGVAHLPEVARPDPEQRPTELVRPVEESEEVRKAMASFVAALLSRCTQAQVYHYVDEATGILRAGAMDPFHEVKLLTCETMAAFCYNHSQMLLHFTEPMGRSLTSCLTHNHARVRIAGLRTLVAVLHCGTWKHNFEVVQVLMAWQDPNKVPVKAFYEPLTNVNYMALLSFDRHPAVRRFWFETLGHMLLVLPDKVDHEPYIFPYLLTGLCDENEEIALEVFWILERCGELYEREHEEDLRKTRQYGFDYGWTYGGRAFCPFPLQGRWAGGGRWRSVRRRAARGPDLMGETCLAGHELRDGDEEDGGELLPLPERDYAWPELRDLEVRQALPRPRLGSRCWVRTHTRRYVKATFNDVVDFRDCTALNAGRLLCSSLAYTEEGITEWLQPMMAALVKFYAGRAWAAGDPEVAATYDCVCKLAGAFLDPASYWAQLRDGLDEASTSDLAQRVAQVRVLALCIEGSVEALTSVQDDGPELGMGRLQPVIPELIAALHASDLLLQLSEASRAALWALLFAFVEPLQRFLSGEQASQLLFIGLALAAEGPPETLSERLGCTSDDVAPLPEQEERVRDGEKLRRLVAALTPCVSLPVPEFSLDSLDDDDDLAAPRPAEPEALFRRAFRDVLARVEDSFQVFQSVVHLTPLAVLGSQEHRSAVLQRLAGFCGAAASPTVRTAGQSLGAYLVLQCSSSADWEAASLGQQAFQVLAAAQLEGIEKVRSLSYMVLTRGLALCRRLFLAPAVDVEALLLPADGGASRPLQWLTALLADQELYKKFYSALETAERSVTGQEKGDFVIMKAKQIREESERRANTVRCLAASTLLLALRRMLLEGRPVGWRQGRSHGSLRALFTSVASLFRTATPTLEPPFVKPTPPQLLAYAAELLRLLLHQTAEAAQRPFRLLDEAAQAILQLGVSGAPDSLPFDLLPEEREALASDFVSTLIGLNLTLPPDPKGKHAPAALDDESKDISLGWEDALTGGAPAGPGSSRSAVPPEVARILLQTSECLRWNAALALYALGMDLCAVCQDGFARCLAKFRQRQEQARALITLDLMDRAQRALRAGPGAA